MSKIKEYAEEQGLTVTPASDVAVYEGTGQGGKSDETDFAIPYITLIQASSEKVKDRTAQPGDFLSSEGVKVDHIDFVPLHIQYTRDFYEAEALKRICSSADRITGRPYDLPRFANAGVELRDGETLACDSCPFNNMHPWDKVACKKGYTVTGYDLDSESPFMFRVKGAAVNVFKNRIVGAVAMGRAKPWGRQYQMTAVKKSNGGNSWMSPELQPTKGHDASEMQFWAAMADGYSSPPHEDTASEEIPFDD